MSPNAMSPSQSTPKERFMLVRAARILVAVSLLAALCAGCSSSAGSKSSAKSMTLYTCATENIEQAVIKGFQAEHSGAKVNVFRAPTGQLNARVAADKRSGGIQADVIWGCDPVTMFGYAAQGLLREWSPPNATDIPDSYRWTRFTGVDVLYMVLVLHKGTPRPASWAELTKPEYKNKVALPSPSFAASALGTLGYFSAAAGYGLKYYQALKSNGAVQVNAPADVLTGVQQGAYKAGLTLANAAYAARKKGSPIDVIWPQPGGIAIPAPIGLTTKRHPSSLAEQFANFAASRAGQKIMAGLGTYPATAGLGGPPIPPGSPIVSPAWATLSAHAKETLAGYVAIFGS